MFNVLESQSCFLVHNHSFHPCTAVFKTSTAVHTTHIFSTWKRPGGQVVSAAALQQEDCEVDSWVLSVFSGFLPQSKMMHVRLIGDSKLFTGVN